MKIRNHNELQEVCQSEAFGRLFITPDAEQIIIEALKLNVELLINSYDEVGSGGYIYIVPHSITSAEGENEYLAELAKYNLEPDMCEFDDLLVQSETEQIHLQLFTMTEYNLLLLYMKKGG